MERAGGDSLILMESLCLFLAGLKRGGVGLEFTATEEGSCGKAGMAAEAAKSGQSLFMSVH